MKSIISTLLITFPFLWGVFWTSENISSHPIKHNIEVLDTLNFNSKYKIDYIDNKLISIHENAFSSLKADYTILQNTKEKLLHLDSSLDSLSNRDSVENIPSYAILPIKNLE